MIFMEQAKYKPSDVHGEISTYSLFPSVFNLLYIFPMQDHRFFSNLEEGDEEVCTLTLCTQSVHM